MLKHLTSRFDYVVIDSPPTLPVTDAVVLSSLVDGVIVVVGSGMVQRDQLAAPSRAWSRSAGRVLGLVLNRVRPPSTLGRYGYGILRARDAPARGSASPPGASASASTSSEP